MEFTPRRGGRGLGNESMGTNADIAVKGVKYIPWDGHEETFREWTKLMRNHCESLGFGSEWAQLHKNAMKACGTRIQNAQGTGAMESGRDGQGNNSLGSLASTPETGSAATISPLQGGAEESKSQDARASPSSPAGAVLRLSERLERGVVFPKFTAVLVQTPYFQAFWAL